MHDLILQILTTATKPVHTSDLQAALWKLYRTEDADTLATLTDLVAKHKITMDNNFVSISGPVALDDYFQKIPVKAVQITDNVLTNGIAGINLTLCDRYVQFATGKGAFKNDWIVQDESGQLHVYPNNIFHVKFHKENE